MFYAFKAVRVFLGFRCFITFLGVFVLFSFRAVRCFICQYVRVFVCMDQGFTSNQIKFIAAEAPRWLLTPPQ